MKRGKKNLNLTHTITMRVSPEANDRLEAIAHEHYRNKSDHIRWLLMTHIEADEERKRAEFAASKETNK